MIKHVIVLLLLAVSGKIIAQTSVVKGRVYDSSARHGLAYATVSLVKAKDSTLIAFSKADSSGHFSLKGIEQGSYLLSTSFVGYAPFWKPLSVNGDAVVSAGNLHMQQLSLLNDVTVVAKRPPVTINNDTVEFNTENFKVQPNAVVEDMLKKMPGVTVDNDGTIRVNGQVVRNVLVNGRPFFTGDPKMATKNLSADAVDKVQVFDKKSDKSAFTGVDDGNAETAINLKLKKDKANAIFGRVTAGGSNERYDAQANINQFKGDKQLSFLGMGNNTNRQGFSMTDILNFTGELNRSVRGGGGVTIRINNNDNNDGLPVAGLGQNQQGIAQTIAGGLNFNNTWNNRKTDLNASYTASNINLETERISYTKNLLPQNYFTRTQQSNSVRSGFQQKLNAALEQRIDTFHSLKLTPALSTQHTNNTTESRYTTLNAADEMLNKGFSRNTSTANALNFTNNLLLRKRFAKKGRTLSLNSNMAYNQSKSNGNLYTLNSFYESGTAKDSLLDQKYSRNAVTRSIDATLTYTEPLGKNMLIEIGLMGNLNKGESERLTYDNDGGKYDKLNNLYSNSFNTEYNYGGASLNFRKSVTKFNYGLGATLQSAILSAYNRTYNRSVNQSFADVLPNANFQYLFSRTKNLRLQYYTSTQQPAVAQLQPVEDVSDPMNVVKGNPDLKRQYVHNVSLSFFSASMETRRNLFAFINFQKTDDAIVNTDVIATNGTRKISYVNTDGVYNLTGNVSYGFPLRKLKSRLELSVNGSMNHAASFINGSRNEIENISFSPGLSYNFSIDNKIDLQLSGRYQINKANYSLQKQFNTVFYQQIYNGELTNYLPFGFTLLNQLNYVINYGRSDGFNTAIPIWNASLAKSFGKNKRAELKLSAFDILERNTGITSVANQNYIIDQQYNVLQRYFLLSFTYSLNKSGLNSGPRAVVRTM